MTACFREIKKCRICGNLDLISVLSLGDQVLTGFFPKSKESLIDSMPLELVKCVDEDRKQNCGLLQLRHTGDLSHFYGKNYGYRSGLNRSMVVHLHQKVKQILKKISVLPGDLILDIGSNDSTLLQAYPKEGLSLVGIDPTGGEFRQYYPSHIQLIANFFSAQAVRSHFGSKKAKVVTSISMFYDLENPLHFMQEVYDILDDHGVWVLEQSYLPTMLAMNSYDTICHEHLEYYAFKQIQWMAERVGFKAQEIELNGVNGGSFSVTLAKKGFVDASSEGKNQALLVQEKELKLDTLSPYQRFRDQVFRHRKELRATLQEIHSAGKKIFGYGASTKGNVLLQFCEITEKDLPYIAEVNPDKYGAYTPGTWIPIIPEREARELRPDYFLVLPWHFRQTILEREAEFRKTGGKLLFPLPKIEII